MRVSWPGLIIAPLVAPAIYGSMWVTSSDNNPLLVALFTMFLGCLVSYPVTLVLGAPALYLLARWRQPTLLSVSLLGFLLGIVIFIGMTLIAWKSSGVDSGPPTESIVTFFVRWTLDPNALVCPLAGMITAGVYWLFASRTKRAPAAQS